MVRRDGGDIFRQVGNGALLIDYDRSAGRIVKLQTFQEAERRKAEETRLALELQLNRECIEREVVLLEAATEEALRKAHGRYFADIPELARRMMDELQ